MDKYDIEQYTEFLLRAAETVLLRKIEKEEIQKNKQFTVVNIRR